MRRRWMRPATSIPAATSATKRTTPERTARSRTACSGTGVKTTTPTSTPTSMIPLRICSVTSVPTSVVTGTDWPRAASLRRRTVTLATSPRRAMSTVFRRKPMKIGRHDVADGHVQRAAVLVGGDGVDRRLPRERLGGHRPQVRDERREHEDRVDVGEDVRDDLEREPLRDDQHQGRDHDGERGRLERRPPLRPQLLRRAARPSRARARARAPTRGCAARPRPSATGRRPGRSRRRRAGAGSRPGRSTFRQRATIASTPGRAVSKIAPVQPTIR